jgi:hypothetical protein
MFFHFFCPLYLPLWRVNVSITLIGQAAELRHFKLAFNLANVVQSGLNLFAEKLGLAE